MIVEEPKLDCRTQVITPENIQFEYALAGPFQRLPAFLFDVIARTVVFGGLTILIMLLLAFAPFGSTITTIWYLLGFFLFSWFYGVLFETWFNGRTLGKMVFRLRTISTDGRPINATQATLRNLLRLADMSVLLSLELFNPEAPPAYVIPTMSVGLLTMIMTSKSQRIGDLVAGTMVISEAHKPAPWNIKPEDNRAYGLAELIPANFRASVSLTQTIGLYMENRTRLNPLRRNDIAKHLARPLIAEFGLLPDTGYDLLLCALYVRIYMSDEQQAEGKARMRTERQPAKSLGQATGLHVPGGRQAVPSSQAGGLPPAAEVPPVINAPAQPVLEIEPEIIEAETQGLERSTPPTPNDPNERHRS